MRRRLWSLRDDVLVEIEKDRALLMTRFGEIRVDNPGPLACDLLARMMLGPISLDNVLANGVEKRPADPPDDRAVIAAVLEKVRDVVVHSLGYDDGEGPMFSAVPVARHPVFQPRAIEPTTPVRLSRFASLRSRDGELVVESPLARYRMVLHRPAGAGVAAALGATSTIAAVAGVLGMSEELVGDVVAHLVAAGLVQIGEAQSRGAVQFAEDLDPRLIRWSHHDLEFHARTRLGRHDGPSGAVFPFAGQFPAPEVAKQLPGRSTVTLFRPDLGTGPSGPPFTEVLERAVTADPGPARTPTAREVGELLFRSARVRSVREAPPCINVAYQLSNRPYPSVACTYELEIYLSVDQCTGLQRGIYHYDPMANALAMINDSEGDLADMLDVSRIAAGMPQRPPVLLTVTARAARSSWTYGGIAYANTLMHLGILQQTLYLVATAMNLAPRMLVLDSGETANRALKLDWPDEVGVGDLILGFHR